MWRLRSKGKMSSSQECYHLGQILSFSNLREEGNETIIICGELTRLYFQ
jgi:hypothetical protein